ncbi:hypothetical protein DICVIV_04759 [Dictyocaulus viviparus]|uniref:Peptidase M13 N-terminal domain-containing protein n=1 Tax=Dictyocaulus viviparus TaxID=29172 RepID=A0A0D8XZC9_DICVI|nr:hypothetical protein DICVIV_04759 [Dictyocaulus viviparus]
MKNELRNGTLPWLSTKRRSTVRITGLVNRGISRQWRLFSYQGLPIYASSYENSSVGVDRTAINHNGIVCTSRECVTIAGFLAGNLNDKVDPCEDFYEFACGNYGLNRNLPASKPLQHTISDVQSRLNKQIKSILQKHFKFAKNHYEVFHENSPTYSTRSNSENRMRSLATRVLKKKQHLCIYLAI